MVHKETYVTGEGLAKLESELEHLRSVSRQGVAQRIQQAKELGGTVDNAEYEVAKNEQAFIEGRILTVENTIKNAILIPDDRKPSGKVEVGSEVTIKDSAGKEHTYTIVGISEADPSEGKISNESPVGQALLGRKKGQQAEVQTPFRLYQVHCRKNFLAGVGGATVTRRPDFQNDTTEQGARRIAPGQAEKATCPRHRPVPSTVSSHPYQPGSRGLVPEGRGWQGRGLPQPQEARGCRPHHGSARHGQGRFPRPTRRFSRLQVHLRSDVLEESYRLMETLDLGDFLGVEGSMFRTRRGEITLRARNIVLLAKAHRPPPEKWHGLRDVEIRYRQRYLDLIANPDVKTVFQNRSRIISTVRSFMDGLGYIEVETPVMVPVAAGAMAQPFVTRHNALDRVLYLRIATELYLKRLIIGGLDRVYEIGRIFRNEGIDMDHNPEFTMLESYQAYADYNDIMALVEQMAATAARTVNGSARATFHGHEIDFTPPWRRLSLKEELKKAGLDIEELSQTEDLVTAARRKGLKPQAWKAGAGS